MVTYPELLAEIHFETNSICTKQVKEKKIRFSPRIQE